MAIKIDNDLLVELGLTGLPEVEKSSLLKHIYETLEMRVGMRLADQMTNEQLDEFEQYFDAKDDAGAFKWLESNFPNYKDIVQEEFDKLKGEVGQSAPQILIASQQALAQGGASAPQQPQPQQQPMQQPQPQQYMQQPGYTQPQQTPQFAPAQVNPQQQDPNYQPGVAPTPPNLQPYAAPTQPGQPQQYSPTGPQQTPQQAGGQFSQPQFPQQQPPAGPGQQQPPQPWQPPQQQ